ncbi:MAG: hypothetical protein GY870_06645 [archaeon]|nr:hypothetical protein [archaeon]
MKENNLKKMRELLKKLIDGNVKITNMDLSLWKHIQQFKDKNDYHK